MLDIIKDEENNLIKREDSYSVCFNYRNDNYMTMILKRKGDEFFVCKENFLDFNQYGFDVNNLLVDCDKIKNVLNDFLF